MVRLMEHDYPGNVRKLDNVVEQAVVLCRGALLELHHLPPELRGGGSGSDPGMAVPASLEAMEQAIVSGSLYRHKGNRMNQARVVKHKRRSGEGAESQASERPSSTEAILESISDGVFTVDQDWRITSFNRAAEEITGVPRSEALGRRCSEVFRSSMCGIDCALGQTLDSGNAIIGKSAFIIDADGNRIPISISTAVLRDADGEMIGGAETFRDLSEAEALRSQLEGRFRVGDHA